MPQKFYPRPKVRAEETMDHRWKQSRGKDHVIRDARQIKLLLKPRSEDGGDLTKKQIANLYDVELQYIREIFGKEGG